MGLLGLQVISSKPGQGAGAALKESLLPPGRTKTSSHQEGPRPRPSPDPDQTQNQNPDQTQNQNQNQTQNQNQNQEKAMGSETPFVPRGTVAIYINPK